MERGRGLRFLSEVEGEDEGEEEERKLWNYCHNGRSFTGIVAVGLRYLSLLFLDS